MKKILSELTIEIIQKCANKCLFCSSLSGRSAQHIIAAEDVISVGVEAETLGLKKISLSGGEPLLHPEIKTIVKELTSIGLDVSIYTTGIVFDGGCLQAFNKWFEFGSSKVRLVFGLQSSTEFIHDTLTRNQGSFLLTKESMLAAREQGYPVEVHFVPNKINLPTLGKSVEDLLSWGIEQISFLRLVPQGYARSYVDIISLDKGDLKVLKELFFQLFGRYSADRKIRFGIPFSGVMNFPKACNAGESKLIIRYDGKILPCEAFKDECFNEYILGDVKYDKLETVLNRAKNSDNLINLKLLTTPTETCPAQILYS